VADLKSGRFERRFKRFKTFKPFKLFKNKSDPFGLRASQMKWIFIAAPKRFELFERLERLEQVLVEKGVFHGGDSTFGHVHEEQSEIGQVLSLRLWF